MFSLSLNFKTWLINSLIWITLESPWVIKPLCNTLLFRAALSVLLIGPIPGILQARTLEWVAISSSKESEKWKWSHSVVSDSSRPHGLQPTRLLCPWDFPGKCTGVGCHCFLRYGILLSFKKKVHSDTCDSTDEPWKYYAKWNQLEMKG